MLVYDYIDENTLGIAMTNNCGEIFEATVATTNGWFDAAVVGRAFGGDPKKKTLARYGETDGAFVAVRNAFSNSDRSEPEYSEAQKILAAFRGDYRQTLYATNGTDVVGTVRYRVNTQGRVYVVTKLAATEYDGTKVAAKTFSGWVVVDSVVYEKPAGLLVYDAENGLGGTAAVLLNKPAPLAVVGNTR